MAKTLRAIRKSQFLTQTEVAKRANIARSTYSNIERGHEGTSLVNYKKIAEALEISLDELFFALNASTRIVNDPEINISAV